MISTHFPLSFPIKIGMFFLESVVCKSRGICNDQRSLFSAAGVWGCFEAQLFQGRALVEVQGAKTPEALEILHLPRMPEIHPRGLFTLN